MEIIVSIIAIVAVLVLGGYGARRGFFLQLVATSAAFFAMMLALRFWYPASLWLAQLMGSEPRETAFGAFWMLFILIFAPLYGLAFSLHERVVPFYPKPIERSVGFLLGCVFGLILTSSLLTSLLLYLPKVWSSYEAKHLLLPLDRAPIATYRSISRTALDDPAEKREHIVFPVYSQKAGYTLAVDWQ